MASCKHCPRTTALNDEQARAGGWRFYNGSTQGGGHLVDVICPVCAGAKPDDPPFGWDVECTTCYWTLSDEWRSGDEPVATAKEAERVASDHRCQPEFRYKDPAGKWYHEHDKEFMDLAYPPKEAVGARA